MNQIRRPGGLPRPRPKTAPIAVEPIIVDDELPRVDPGYTVEPEEDPEPAVLTEPLKPLPRPVPTHVSRMPTKPTAPRLPPPSVRPQRMPMRPARPPTAEAGWDPRFKNGKFLEADDIPFD